jgi:hypothetical protein
MTTIMMMMIGIVSIIVIIDWLAIIVIDAKDAVRKRERTRLMMMMMMMMKAGWRGRRVIIEREREREGWSPLWEPHNTDDRGLFSSPRTRR